MCIYIYIYPGNELYPFKGVRRTGIQPRSLGKDLRFQMSKILNFTKWECICGNISPGEL